METGLLRADGLLPAQRDTAMSVPPNLRARPGRTVTPIKTASRHRRYRPIAAIVIPVREAPPSPASQAPLGRCGHSRSQGRKRPKNYADWVLNPPNSTVGASFTPPGCCESGDVTHA